jgi:hypothetical protein
MLSLALPFYLPYNEITMENQSWIKQENPHSQNCGNHPVFQAIRYQFGKKGQDKINDHNRTRSS